MVNENPAIRCVAIDDEPSALMVIEKFCDRMDGRVNLTTFTDPELGLAEIMAVRPHLVFLDIEMENISGLDIASRLPEGTCFVFTTAYLQYAPEGFNLDAVDYLHKPFSYDRFRMAIDKALRRMRPAAPAPSPAQQVLVVKQEYNNVTIPLADILYIEAMEGYSKIYRTDGRCVVSRVILKNIHSMLPSYRFLRIHRSFIVSIDKIRGFNRQEVTVEGGRTLPVGRQYAGALSPLGSRS